MNRKRKLLTDNLQKRFPCTMAPGGLHYRLADGKLRSHEFIDCENQVADEFTPITPSKDALEVLDGLVTCAKQILFMRPRHRICFPNNSGPCNWDDKEIAKLNALFFSNLNCKGNVYCIFTRTNEEEDWIPQYVGQRKSKNLRQRLRSHLVKKSKKTGSQIVKIQRAVGRGEQIGISHVLIKPESLRSFVEESIISSAKKTGALKWNIHHA